MARLLGDGGQHLAIGARLNALLVAARQQVIIQVAHRQPLRAFKYMVLRGKHTGQPLHIDSPHALQVIVDLSSKHLLQVDLKLALLLQHRLNVWPKHMTQQLPPTAHKAIDGIGGVGFARVVFTADQRQVSQCDLGLVKQA